MKSIPSLSLNEFRSRKDWEGHIWLQITKELAKTSSTQEIQGLLNMLLTAHEKRQMIKRASAISLLGERKSYREIGRLLWLSPVTISAIRKSLRGQKEYMSSYARNKKPEKKSKPLTKKEWEQLEFSLWVKSLFHLPRPPLRHPRLMRALGYKSFDELRK